MLFIFIDSFTLTIWQFLFFFLYHCIRNNGICPFVHGSNCNGSFVIRLVEIRRVTPVFYNICWRCIIMASKRFASGRLWLDQTVQPRMVWLKTCAFFQQMRINHIASVYFPIIVFVLTEWVFNDVVFADCSICQIAVCGC